MDWTPPYVTYGYHHNRDTFSQVSSAPKLPEGRPWCCESRCQAKRDAWRIGAQEKAAWKMRGFLNDFTSQNGVLISPMNNLFTHGILHHKMENNALIGVPSQWPKISSWQPPLKHINTFWRSIPHPDFISWHPNKKTTIFLGQVHSIFVNSPFFTVNASFFAGDARAM